VFDVVVKVAEHFASQQRILSANLVKVRLELFFTEAMSPIKNIEGTFGFCRVHVRGKAPQLRAVVGTVALR
jgi:hypothetical protein